MNQYKISKLDMILKGLLKDNESPKRYCAENYKNSDDIDILGSLLKLTPENLKQTIDLLYAQIEERNELKHKVLSELEHQIMKVQNSLPAVSGGYSINPVAKNSLDKVWIDLETEKLKEEIGCFKDLSYLQSKLVYLIGKYKEEKGKYDLMKK